VHPDGRLARRLRQVRAQQRRSCSSCAAAARGWFAGRPADARRASSSTSVLFRANFTGLIFFNAPGFILGILASFPLLTKQR
jgi:hypothetical protein